MTTEYDPTERLDPTEKMPERSSDAMRIGQYVLRQQIGEGGMGEVWLAEQGKPIQRKVALKIIKKGMDSKEIVARFEAERQALALMNHPSVAKVHDAGTTPDGRPFFIMEYVPGAPITVYCDRHKLGLRQRLELFRDVCDGVQHAHQKAIIHRDLKPSNVLVMEQDGKPLPKIIDFGVAKAISQKLTEQTMFTQLGVLIGTPEYMSPEQAELTGEDVDTRTDVYSLGVILYELLVGALPFEPKELRQAGFEGIRRIIREMEPPRPSTRISTLGEKSSVSARERRTTVSSLRSQLRGDLDWITMKALEKDRGRRYMTPVELSRDIERHLMNRPVEARPPTLMYRVSRYAKRNRFGVTVASLGLVLLIAFAVAMAIQAGRIARERDRADAAAVLARKEAATAQRVSQLMVDLFARSNPGQSRGDQVTVREVLDAGAEQVLQELGDEPEVQAKLLATIGDSYRGLALWDRAVTILEYALEKTATVYGDRSLEAARVKSLLSWPLVHLAKFDRADQLNREALAAMREILEPCDPEIGVPINHLAFSVLRGLKDTKEVEALLREALECQRNAYGESHALVVTTLDHLGWVLLRQRRYPESEEMNRQALKVQKEVNGTYHPRTGYILQRLGYTLKALGRYEEALACFREGIDVAEHIYEGDHPEFGYAYQAVGLTLASMGDMEEANTWTGRAVETMRKFLDPNNPDLAKTLFSHGKMLARAGRLEDADLAFVEAENIFRDAFGSTHETVADCLRERGDVSRRMGRRETAESQLREALDIQLKVAPDGSAQYVVRTFLAMVLIERGQLDTACAEAEAAAGGLLELDGEDSPHTALARSVFGHCHAQKGDTARAEPLLQTSYEKLNTISPPTDPNRITSLEYLVRFYTEVGRRSEAARLRTELDKVSH